MSNDWRVWDANKKYGEVFYKRATGELPEMESSKAVTKIITPLMQDGNTLVDVGCGGGHYLKSIAKRAETTFDYKGVDATPYYIEQGEKAWKDNQGHEKLTNTSFQVGDIFNVPLEDGTGDVVICNNVLLHLPSVEKPISELIRVSKKYILIRALIGRTSFRVKQVNSPEEYDEKGEPLSFNFHNIYSETYIRQVIDKCGTFKSVKIWEDNDFSADNINKTTDVYDTKNKHKVTTVVNGMQINNYLIQPWTFVLIEK